MSKRGVTGNEGIQVTGGNVTADVLAVGRNAHAQKTVLGENDRKQLTEALAVLSSELEKLKVSPADRNELKKQVSDLRQITAAPGADKGEAKSTFTGFIQKLKEIGVVVNQAAGLVAPLHTIAGLLRVPLASLGVPI